jgi:anti-anti-sigma regulatory factor
LSLAEITVIDTAHVSWLVVLHKRFRQSGGRLVLHSLRPQVVEMLRSVRFELVLDIAENEAAALELLRARGS